MFDRLTTLPHGLRVFVEALLYGLQYILMLPARDAPLHAGGAALLERTVATRICPIASQLLPVLLVRNKIREVHMTALNRRAFMAATAGSIAAPTALSAKECPTAGMDWITMSLQARNLAYNNV